MDVSEIPVYGHPDDLPDREPNPADTDDHLVELVFLPTADIVEARGFVEDYYEWPVDRIERSREIRDAIEYCRSTGRQIAASEAWKVGQPIEEGLLGYLVWIPRATVDNVYRYTMF